MAKRNIGGTQEGHRESVNDNLNSLKINHRLRLLYYNPYKLEVELSHSFIF